ncbi:MAG: Rpn family recombination-promoting nuclease/putative transposase [Gammaproteobacteria bacterium]
MTELTNTPHDKIFRLSLSNLPVAKDFLKNHLPKQILKIINLKNLTVCPNSYITEELAENLSDILYKTNIIHGKQDCYIYTLIEHQSVPLWNMPLRIMQYQLAVIDTHLRQNPKQKKLPIVISLLVYNGTKSPYPLSLNIFDLFHDPELAKKTFAKPACLVDVTAMSDLEIKKHNIVGLLEFSQKHIRDRKFLKLTIKNLTYMINQLLNSVPNQEIANNNWLKNYITGVLHYVYYFANIVDDAEFYKELEEIEFIKKENIMGALARKIENQGIQKGMHQGIQKVALKLLQKGIERSIITETTGLSEKEIEEISNKNPDEI